MSLQPTLQRKHVEPRPSDVLTPHGLNTRLHSGNISFRTLTRDSHNSYVSAASEKTKTDVALTAMESVQEHEPQGRFLMRDPGGVEWLQLHDMEAFEYTCEALTKYPVPSGPTGGCLLLHGLVEDHLGTYIWLREAYKKGHREIGSFISFIVTVDVLRKFEFTSTKNLART